MALISSGQAPLDADFRDASPSGEDVFFATPTSLLPQDYGLIDIYDARVGGGLPVPAERAPVCEGEACQSVPAPPPETTPSSLLFRGAGNVHEGAAKAKRCPKAKRKVKKHGKTRCVKKHRKARHKKKAHRRHARRGGHR